MMAMGADKLQQFLETAFPGDSARHFKVEASTEGCATVRMHFSERLLRPGGTISGPAQMTLVDTAMLLALASSIGDRALAAVTSNIQVAFLRRPRQADLIAEAMLLKVGRRLAYGQVKLRSTGSDKPVAHATCTYALAPVEPAP